MRKNTVGASPGKVLDIGAGVSVSFLDNLRRPLVSGGAGLNLLSG